jgi:PTS system nitrogen regulatory IIA component
VAGLLAREKLGSTGLGGGIAIPHCRLRDWQAPVGVLLSFSEGLPFDAPDGADVDLMCALVVPQEASDEHLQILATLARLFSDAELCAALRAARTSEALYNTTLNWAERTLG